MERQPVRKQKTQRAHMEGFNLKKLNEIEGKELYRNNKRVYSPSQQQMFTRIFVLLHVSVSQDHHQAKLMRLQKSFLSY
jgi:hypothetical protein